MRHKVTKAALVVGVTVLCAAPMGVAHAQIEGDFDPTLTYGSVEAIPNPAVVDTAPLRGTSLSVREAFVEHVVECGYVADVVDALTDAGAITTINDDNLSVDVAGGGFNGRTTASIVYTAVDEGSNAASHADIYVLTNALGYVFSQGSAFLLDGNDISSFAFPANYAVMQFADTPTIQESAALFVTVGQIDPRLFMSTSSGYTQYGQSYLSLQSAVADQDFIDGYVAAAAAFNAEHESDVVEYTPVVNGEPGLYTGGADFPSNNWTNFPEGQRYLGRIADAAEPALKEIHADHLEMIALAELRLSHLAKASDAGRAAVVGHVSCQR